MRALLKAFLALTLAAAFCLSFPAWAAQARPSQERPKIDLVFAIDTTGSMGGLIQAAKTKVWSIVNQISTGKPAPEVRVGLIAYRDRGDAYVTQVTDLTADLDAMYAKLMSFQAQGGGDDPESVNQALADAVNAISWSNASRVMRLIFLVGDAPPHRDYPNDPKYPETARQAVRKGITIHAVRCGHDPETERYWKDIAHRAEGRYFSIDQSGGTVTVATPFDGEIARLDGAIRESAVVYGDRAEREVAKKKMDSVATVMAAAPAEAKAERAAYGARVAKSAPSTVFGSDLVTAVGSGTVKLADVPADALPEEMRSLSPDDRAAFIEKRAAERKALQEKLDGLTAKRAAHLAAEAKKASKADSLDAKVLDAVREKAANIDVTY